MKNLLLVSLITTGFLMAANGGQPQQNSGKQMFMQCVEKAQTKEEFLACKQEATGMMGQRQNMSINDMKTKILTKINERITKLEESKQCVAKAETKEALKECRPERGERQGGMGQGMSPNQQMGGQQMQRPMGEPNMNNDRHPMQG